MNFILSQSAISSIISVGSGDFDCFCDCSFVFFPSFAVLFFKKNLKGSKVSPEEKGRLIQFQFQQLEGIAEKAVACSCLLGIVGQ